MMSSLHLVFFRGYVTAGTEKLGREIFPPSTELSSTMSHKRDPPSLRTPESCCRVSVTSERPSIMSQSVVVEVPQMDIIDVDSKTFCTYVILGHYGWLRDRKARSVGLADSPTRARLATTTQMNQVASPSICVE